MYKDILGMLRCPICNGEVQLLYGEEYKDEVIEGKLICSNAHEWSIHQGVINFGSQEQNFANLWSEAYKKQDYEELDKEIWKRTPNNLKELYTKARLDIINNINHSKPEHLVDIATGRGMLLTEMVQKISYDAHIICLDLSFEVLKNDRLKVKKINPAIRVNYIACDATNVPIKDDVIDMCTSFFGIANMMDSTQKGIEEANRILKDGSSLLDSSIIIKDNSRGYEVLKDFLLEQDMNKCQEFAIEQGFKDLHVKGKFKEVNIKEIGHSIGEKNEYDLLPFQGEGFQVVTAYCKKQI